MTWLFISGYFFLIGAILLDEDTELKYVRRLIKQRLTPYDINVDITLRGNETVSVSASKSINGIIRHVCIESVGLIEAVWKLVRFIEKNIEDWLEDNPY